MKKIILILAAACLTVPAGAQGFLNKLKKGAEKVVNANQKVNQALSKGTSQLEGATAWVPYFDLNVVGCEGDMATGEVVMTLAATPKLAKSLQLGCNENVAADAAGNTWKFEPLNSKSSACQEMVPGIPKRYKMLVPGVNAGTPEFAVVSLSFYANGDKNCGSNMSGVSPVILNNIPIAWGPFSDTNIVAAPAQLKEVCDIKVASCEGNKENGTVKLVLTVTTDSKKANLSLNNGKPIEIYDLAGKSYDNIPTDTNYTGRDLVNEIPNQWEFTIEGFAPEAEVIPMAKIDFYANDYANDLRVGSNMAGISPLLIKNISITWK